MDFRFAILDFRLGFLFGYRDRN